MTTATVTHADPLRHVLFFPGNATGRAAREAFHAPRPRHAIHHHHEDHHPSPEAEAFFTWLLGHAGLDAASYRRKPVHRRLSACLRTLSADSIEEARATLERRPELMPRAIGALIIGVTSFFRDTPVFDDLRQHTLPALAAGRPGVRVWSAGCSHGAELYSVAMLLDELGLLEGSELLGTDCRREAIARARSGRFEAAALDGLDRERVARHLVSADGAWYISPRLSAWARWGVSDLLTESPRGQWDLILCRNMTIYLRPHAAQAVWQRLYLSLRPGGVLVVGKAERPDADVAMSRLAPCLFQKPGGPRHGC